MCSPVSYQGDIEIEIARRLQNPGEPVLSYVTELQTLIRRHGQINEDQTLQWLYRNLLLEYRLQVRRADFTNVVEFLSAVRELEDLLAEIKPSKNQMYIRPEDKFTSITTQN